MIDKSAVIGVHGGHAKVGSRGAKCYMDEVNEDRKLKKGMLKAFRRAGYTTVDCTVANATSQMTCLKKILKKSITKKTTCNFSLHLNAGGGRGVELYLPTGADHAQYLRARNFLNEFCSLFGFENRGVKGIGSWYVNKHLKKCYLLEIGFVDNTKDHMIYNKYGAEYIGKVAGELAMKYLY